MDFAPCWFAMGKSGPAAGRDTGSRLSTNGVAARLFITCWLIFVLHFATNTVREIYPALTLGDHLSFDVSEYDGFHPDIFVMPGRGAFINNNPGASILGAIPYTVARPVIDWVVGRVQAQRAAAPSAPPEYDTIYPMAREFVSRARERGLDVKFGAGAATMQAGLMAPVSAAAAVVMFVILRHRTGSLAAAACLSLLYAFATPILYRTAQLNQNVLVAHCVLFTFAVLWRPWDPVNAPRRPWYLLAGLLAGWSVVLDYSGTLVPLVLIPYAVLRRTSLPPAARAWRDLPELALGALLSISVLLAYQWACFGNPFLPAQAYMPPANFTDLGYRGFSLPQLDLLIETAVSPRYGLFVSSPLLLLALAVPWWRRSVGRIVGPLELCTIAAFCAAFFLFCAANQYGRMQFNSGVRHIVPVTPFLFLIAAGALLRMPRLVAIFVSVLTMYWSWCLAMYRDVEQGAGVIDSILVITTSGPVFPWLRTVHNLGYVQETGIVALGVLGITALVLAVVWFPALWSFRLPRKSPVLNRLDSRQSRCPKLVVENRDERPV